MNGDQVRVNGIDEMKSFSSSVALPRPSVHLYLL